jgi:AraC-like DNA-binding protein
MGPNASHAAPFRFSTDDVPVRDRAAAWREVLGRIHLRMDVEPAGGAPIKANVESHPWSCVSLYFGDTNAVTASRTPDLINDGDGDFRLLYADTAYEFMANGVRETVAPGEAALLFNGAVSKVHYAGRARIGAVRIRRDSLAAAVPDLDDRPIRRVAPNAPALRLITDYAASLRRQGPTCDPALARHVATHLIDLVALALNSNGETHRCGGNGAARAARLAAIRADVLAHLSRVCLSAKSVARRHGVSDRYVHRLFEETGQTFSRFVEEERLKRAFALLTDSRRAAMRIGDIATEVGFPEHSTFNRAFRRRFGETPSSVRGGCNAQVSL